MKRKEIVERSLYSFIVSVAEATKDGYEMDENVAPHWDFFGTYSVEMVKREDAIKIAEAFAEVIPEKAKAGRPTKGEK